MKVRGLAWVIGITLAACSAGEMRAPAALANAAGAAPARIADPTAASPLSVPAPSRAAAAPNAIPHADHVAVLPAAGESAAGPVLPPEVVSLMTYDQYRLTLDSHGPGLSASETGRGGAVDLLGSTSVVDDPAPPADIELE